jgi:hypothetical protein
MNMLMTLQARQTASLAPEGTVRVRCLRGMLWIVGQRDGEDCVLEAGQTALLGAQRHYLSSVHRDDTVSFELRQPASRSTPGAGRDMARLWQSLCSMPGSNPGISGTLTGFWQRLRQLF